ncbi:MAG TPA: flagellar protein FlgN [Planctomycetota bacterium]|nr:flagellar protein FlgN [Planctomycetota bacterium]
MRGDLNDLVVTLERLVEAAKALGEASRRKTRALSEMDLEKIAQATRDEEQLTQRMSDLRDTARDLVGVLTGEPSSPTGGDVSRDGSLGRLIEGLPEPGRTRLAVLRTALGEAMKGVQNVNVTNSIVSRKSLRHFREMLAVLSGAGPVDDRYNSSGRVTRRLGPSRLVNQIA